jgi:hypothetical protein
MSPGQVATALTFIRTAATETAPSVLPFALAFRAAVDQQKANIARRLKEFAGARSSTGHSVECVWVDTKYKKRGHS